MLPAHRLDEADRLREGSPEERRRAYEAYAGTGAALDPADPSDAERIRWLFRHLYLAASRPDPRIEAILARAEGPGSPDEVSMVARVLRGQEAKDRGDLALAERIYREVLAKARGSGTEQERAALANLALLYHREGREMESLLLSRRMADLAESAGDAWGVAVTRVRISSILHSLGDDARHARSLEGMDAILDALEPERRDAVRLSLVGHRILALLGDGRPREALEVLDGAEREFPADGTLRRDPRVAADFRARALLQADRPGEALEALDGVSGVGPRLDSTAVAIRLLRVQALLGADRAAEGSSAAKVLLAELESAPGEGPGAGVILDTAWRLARILADRCGAPVEARRALDLAGTAALRRLLEVQRCVASMPELQVIGPEDRVILEDARRRWARRQAEIADAAARALAAEGLGRAPDPDRYVAVCAWCRRVCLPGGSWMPVESLLPPEGRILVTHGICPGCRANLMPPGSS